MEGFRAGDDAAAGEGHAMRKRAWPHNGHDNFARVGSIVPLDRSTICRLTYIMENLASGVGSL